MEDNFKEKATTHTGKGHLCSSSANTSCSNCFPREAGQNQRVIPRPYGRPVLLRSGISFETALRPHSSLRDYERTASSRSEAVITGRRPGTRAPLQSSADRSVCNIKPATNRTDLTPDLMERLGVVRTFRPLRRPSKNASPDFARSTQNPNVVVPAPRRSEARCLPTIGIDTAESNIVFSRRRSGLALSTRHSEDAVVPLPAVGNISSASGGQEFTASSPGACVQTEQARQQFRSQGASSMLRRPFGVFARQLFVAVSSAY
mmetsp:Transcript_20648/g.36836  ORF Transcript_20648/g.36836 Transcript_20648/m.36836 type:complete len:261 (-) Transcript_20648:649-1431(-)